MMGNFMEMKVGFTFFRFISTPNIVPDFRLGKCSPKKFVLHHRRGWCFFVVILRPNIPLEAVRVMDLSGKTVRNLELGAAGSKTELDLSGLPKGIYALQARAEGKVFMKKVVVE